MNNSELNRRSSATIEKYLKINSSPEAQEEIEEQRQIGLQIKKRRENLNLSREQLSNLIEGISRDDVFMLEHGLLHDEEEMNDKLAILNAFFKSKNA